MSEQYDSIEIHEPDDYEKLSQLLDLDFKPSSVGLQLKAQIRSEVEFILIERDYVDKDYRSTYYNFYAKMGRTYRDDCVRLHLFDGCVSFDEEKTDLICSDGRITDHYFGYIVLRPTINSTLGRSILSPKVRVGVRGKVIASKHRVHLLGHTLSIKGFPSMAQHVDIAVCAHVSSWAILRHYSERYPQHREYLIHEISKLATPFDPGGLTPALGLDIFEAERVFQAAGCFPVIVVKQPQKKSEFYAQLLAYLESGFPLFVAISSFGHAIVVTGFSWQTTANTLPTDNFHVWSKVDTLLGVDDNLLPYETIDLQSSNEPTDCYTADDFDAFIVPLPEKIYYPAHAIETLSTNSLNLIHERLLGIREDEDYLRRYFITTISALRRFARENRSQLGDILVDLIMCLKTAQFIWIVEYATISQWDQGHVAVRSIVDAAASLQDKQPVWLSHNDQSAILFDRSSATATANRIHLNRAQNFPLSRIEQNLQPVGV